VGKAISKKHKKHTKLARAARGTFHRNELALVGAPSEVIRDLAEKIARQLEHLSFGYVDVSPEETERASVFTYELTQKITVYESRLPTGQSSFEGAQLLQPADAVLVNGNQFRGDKQLVIIHKAQKEALQQQLDHLTNVVGVVLGAGIEEVYDFLKPLVDGVPLIPINDIDQIAELVSTQVTVPPIKGLVLAGGKSTRMGEDKGQIVYHDLPQREHAATLLKPWCSDVALSVAEQIPSDFNQIVDRFIGLGPLSGILSAFQKDPNAAWLCIATDIPLLDEQTIQQLVEHRNPSKVATCFYNSARNSPEPLVTIWEPRAYPLLLSWLSMGYACPRRALVKSDVELIELPDVSVLHNANTPEEKQLLINQIKNG